MADYCTGNKGGAHIYRREDVPGGGKMWICKNCGSPK